MDKCIRQLPPVRVPETLETALMRLAAAQERSLSEYIKLVLSHHVWGHGESVNIRSTNDNERGHSNA